MIFSARGIILSLLTVSVVANGIVKQEGEEGKPSWTKDRDCKCVPTDPCWPEEKEWNSLNATVEGRLVRSKPLGSVCHDPDYDEAECNKLKELWIQPTLQ